MMKSYFRIMAVLVAAILSAAPAIAGPIFNVGDSISFSLSAPYVRVPLGYGGLFTITDKSGGASIQTFCLELNEYIHNDDYVGSISGSAVKGGRGGGNPADPISSATGWLYS